MKSFNTELVIAGGGCGGFGAAVQAARMGVKTLLIEETPWLGGMITAAGVSAFDGNKYAVGGGIYLELRRKIEEYYGGADKTFTGWISLTCFEPSVAARFIHEIASTEENLTIWFNTKLVGVLKNGNRVTGLRVMHEGEETEINARLTVEATEFGDVLLMAGIPHRFGRDSKEESGENSAPELQDDIIQDMTFCATLKKYDGKAPVVPASPRYDENRFINSTDVHCDTTDEAYLNHKLHSWESFITYAALPNDKYLLNWPFRSNDYPTTRDIYDDHAGRSEHFRKAKELTLDYVHYMQTKLGHPEWGIATDEYPTEDNLPFIPYVREGRRGNG
ncbi:MAG: FAD-dependent oxidoreductase, partial [Ignavibacteriaceae bacterium]|nr:FAD-dependent oxidoreductase [Ignavibacteriaceae bacterium]